MNPAPQDVLILGGGLAGLTLAMQLKQAMPELGVRVVERREHPVPVAAHKIGESSVPLTFSGTVVAATEPVPTCALTRPDNALFAAMVTLPSADSAPATTLRLLKRCAPRSVTRCPDN